MQTAEREGVRLDNVSSLLPSAAQLTSKTWVFEPTTCTHGAYNYISIDLHIYRLAFFFTDQMSFKSASKLKIKRHKDKTIIKQWETWHQNGVKRIKYMIANRTLHQLQSARLHPPLHYETNTGLIFSYDTIITFPGFAHSCWL